MLSRLLMRSYRSFTLVTILLTASSGASGPHLALSAARRSTSSDKIVILDVVLSSGESRLTAMQWDLSYIPTHLVPTGSPFYTTGPAAKASGKETTCRLVSAGDVRCILVGMNTSVINPGKIASLTFQISETAEKSSAVSLNDIVGVSTGASQVPFIGETPSIKVAH